MFGDPKLIRSHTIKFRVNDYEFERINKAIDQLGAQKSSYVRDTLFEKLDQQEAGQKDQPLPAQINSIAS